MPASPPKRAVSGPIELRMITPRSAHSLFALARDPAVSELLTWPAHESIDDSLGFIHDARALAARGTAWLPGIFLDGSDGQPEQLIGATGLAHIDLDAGSAEGGTWFGVPFQRHGYNQFAKAALLAVAFELLGLQHVEFLVRTDNEPSLRSMRRFAGITELDGVTGCVTKDGTSYPAIRFVVPRTAYRAQDWSAVSFVP